jgi:hypothetical protein
MSVEIENMRSEVSFRQESGTRSRQQAGQPEAIDRDQLREIIRDLVREIMDEDIYTLFRTRGI